jgi:hypothetical protein
VTDYQDPFSTAAEDLELNFMPKDPGKHKGTLPRMDSDTANRCYDYALAGRRQNSPSSRVSSIP